jgi:hypothetical protein
MRGTEKIVKPQNGSFLLTLTRGNWTLNFESVSLCGILLDDSLEKQIMMKNAVFDRRISTERLCHPS